MSGRDRAGLSMRGANVLALWLTWIGLVQSSGSVLSHVERYELVRPQRLQQRHRRSLQDQQQYPETVQYRLAVEGRNQTIHLTKNRNLISTDYTETHYAENGTRVTRPVNEEHCYYHGTIEGIAESSVSVGICSGMSGFVRTRQQVYLIEPLGQTEDGDHALYRQEHLKTSGSSMLYDQDQNQDQDRDQGPRLAGLARSRPWNSEPVPGPQRFVELFVVVDNTEYKRFGSETRPRILGAINHVDKLYRRLNIHVMLVGLEIWTNADRIDVDTRSEKTLDNFLAWRQADLLQRTKHDNAQFVTGKDFDTDTVGLANKFAMCTGNSGAVNQDHHKNHIGLASTIAHEMGHNFGMSHDAAGCTCPSSSNRENCIMTEKLRTGGQAFPEFFSSCSLDQLSEFMTRARPSCLDKPGSVKTVASGPLCGNALLDPGEQCDCGTVEECRNPCCDASTCRLTDGSQCAHGRCCDRCQFVAAHSVCRESAGTCDLPEHCTGVSAECPEDSFEMNGKPCYGQAHGFCYDGQCPTHEQHCWRLFGPGARVGPDKCFTLNSRGEEGANCGRTDNAFIRCSPQNFMCGTMFCGGGGDSITGKRARYTVSGIDCQLAVDEDKNRNLDMVPDGTTCGPNKVCLGHKCVDTAVFGKQEDCAKKCNNNGVCNHKNECHCEPGWAPPHCNVQYADLPQGRGALIGGVCAALFVLLLIVGLIVGLRRCKKENVENFISKRKVHSAPGRLNPMFQESNVKDRPQISQPTFMESTAAHVCDPLMVSVVPSRPAPQPPKKFPAPTEPDLTKPQPPSKPLPPLNKPQSNAAKPNRPLVPPVKPSPPPAARTKPCIPPLPSAKPQIHRLT